MAEAPRRPSRCLRNRDPRARLTNMVPNSANALKSWPPLGAAVERKSEHSTAEGGHLSLSNHCFFTYWAMTFVLIIESCSSGAVAISITSPSKKTALAQVLLQRAESRLVWVLLPLLPITFSISSSHPCSAS